MFQKKKCGGVIILPRRDMEAVVIQCIEYAYNGMIAGGARRRMEKNGEDSHV